MGSCASQPTGFQLYKIEMERQRLKALLTAQKRRKLDSESVSEPASEDEDDGADEVDPGTDSTSLKSTISGGDSGLILMPVASSA